jgi:2-succinyl-5-enolpyruvyl-6-hydroxy-3-cyclohexene-1-carboxylate synthase
VTDSTAVQTGRLLLDELVRSGMREVVVAPGSRSAPLAYAAAEQAQAGRVRLHVRIDERSAAFLALGLAKVSRLPVAVICTSGTAAANFHPAVLEASESGIPLVVLTADRPAELRGVGANQTVDQNRLYGGAIRAYLELADAPDLETYVRSSTARLVAAATGTLTGDPGPVQLNIPLREPLTAAVARAEPLPAGEPWLQVAAAHVEPASLDPDPERTLVVVGDAPPELGHQARQIAARYGWPMIAEPSSGARTGSLALPGPLLLGVPGLLDRWRPDRVLVVGRPTLTRSVQRLLRHPEIAVEVRAASPRWADASRRASRVGIGLPPISGARVQPGEWSSRWLRAGRWAAAARDRWLAEQTELSGPVVADAVVRTCAVNVPVNQSLPWSGPSADRPPLMIVGSSLPIRDVDLVAADLPGLVMANRGVAGIDGTVSTAIGAALVADRQTYALMGDLTFRHDINGLLLGPDDPRPDLCLVVVDNDGGGIFGTLEHADGDPGTFERLFSTPHGSDLQAACAASGIAYRRAESRAELDEALRPAAGLRVVHVRTSRAELVAQAEALREAVTVAVLPLLDT